MQIKQKKNDMEALDENFKLQKNDFDEDLKKNQENFEGIFKNMN